jgi:outer membrane lipoprotein-sorting protein
MTATKIEQDESHMRTVIAILMLCCMLAAAAMAGAEGEPVDQGPAGTTGKAGAFARISKTVSGVKTIAGSFRQERRLAMLARPVVSTGRFYCEKPDRLRWELVSPEPSGFLVNRDQVKQWKGKEGPSGAFETGQNPLVKLIVDQIFAWTTADFKWLEERYVINVVQDDPITLKLVPRSSKEKKYIDHLRISFEVGTNYVHVVNILEKGGDSTRIEFFDLVINNPLPQGLFH